MSRVSRDEIDEQGYVKNGYDYELQVWVTDYIIQDCGHSDALYDECCNGGILAGQDIREVKHDT